LTQLAQGLKRLRNVQVTVKEADGQVIFLRKVIEGGCDSSYGIHVAKMAGVPDAVIERAWEILAGLESHGAAGPALNPPTGGATVSAATPNDSLREPSPGYPGAASAPGRKAPKPAPQTQVDLFQPAMVEIENPLHRKAYEELLRMDLDHMSPMQAMMKLHELKARLFEASEASKAGKAGEAAEAKGAAAASTSTFTAGRRA
jgi:DNA mismatch repair protein MutS